MLLVNRVTNRKDNNEEVQRKHAKKRDIKNIDHLFLRQTKKLNVVGTRYLLVKKPPI
jgi:hypothetical protein